MSPDPLDVDLARPNTWLQPTTAREPDGKEVKLPCFERHLLCDEDGLFPANFNSWEDKVVLAELQQPGTVAWYRNPARASQDSLGVTYEVGGEIKIVRPDFIFFAQRQDGNIVSDIVDPHGIQFGDALPRLKGLARYAQENPGIYRRIEVVAQIDSKFRAIDLTEASARAVVLAAATIREVYEHDVAVDYSP
jgi:type III restriction enzyme